MQNRVEPIAETTHDDGNSFIRVILADRYEITRIGIRRILGAEDDIRVVALAGNSAQLISSVGKFPAEIALVALTALEKPLDTIKFLREKHPAVALILLADALSLEEAIEFYRCGACGIIEHSVPAELLVKCIRKVNEGEVWISQEALGLLIVSYRESSARLPQVSDPLLSIKHQRILAAVVRGMRNREIAEEIGTSEQVIKNDLRKLYQRFGVSDRLELVLYAIHNNLLQRPQDEEQTA